MCELELHEQQTSRNTLVRNEEIRSCCFSKAGYHYIPLFFGVEEEYYYSDATTFFYFDGQKYLDQLKNQSIWLAGHTHSVRTKDLVQGDGRTIHLKLNPVGYPDEDSGNAERMDEFLIKR